MSSPRLGPVLLSLDARCWTCGSPDMTDEGMCLDCSPSERSLPATAAATIYGNDVFSLMKRMRSDESMGSVDDEIAAMAGEVRRMMDTRAKGQVLSESEISAQIRLLLIGIVAAKEKRQTMMEKGRHFLTADMFRMFLLELEGALRSVIKDPHVIADVQRAISRIQVRFSRMVEEKP